MLKYRRVLRDLAALSARLLQQEIAVCLILFLVAPFGTPLSGLAQQTAPTPQISGASSSQSAPQRPEIEKEGPANSTSPTQENPSNVPGTTQGQQQGGGTQAPLGTAVAPYEKGIGVAASRPAGAVIAPAKQRRTRSFVIKLGVLIGACAAVGTVVALSNASPSQPH